MTGLYLVREEAVPVEQLRAGDRLKLPSGVLVTVERVDEYDDGFVVRWWRPAERGEPGHRGARQHAIACDDEWNGCYYGSTVAFPARHCLAVDRG